VVLVSAGWDPQIHTGFCPLPPMLRHMLVEFSGEPGYGAGVTREWLTLLAAQLFHPQLGLFVRCAGNPLAIMPSPGRNTPQTRACPPSSPCPACAHWVPELKLMCRAAPAAASVQPNHLQYLQVAGRVMGAAHRQFLSCNARQLAP
jgi:hypothetical protein